MSPQQAPPPTRPGRIPLSSTVSGAGGFTLLEVLVAMAILGIAVVTAIQLASQSLRLLKLSGDHQQAVLLADQITRGAEPNEERTETGQEGPFLWERRITLVPVAEELDPTGARRGAAVPRLFVISVSVRWDSRSVELATLRSSMGEPSPSSLQSPGILGARRG